MGKKKKKAQEQRLEQVRKILEIISYITGIIFTIYSMLKD